MYRIRNVTTLGIIATALIMASCASLPSQKAKISSKEPVLQANPAGFRTLSRSDLDRVIDGKLSRSEAANYLKNIRIDDYDLQDPNTNWSDAKIADKYSVYYLTYRQRFFMLLLVDGRDRISSCVDIVVLPRPSSDYELGMGLVEVDRDHINNQIVVAYNKNWNGNYSDDIIAAYVPNIETQRLEEVSYKYIKIYRDQ